jgi:hypothetical protein
MPRRRPRPWQNESRPRQEPGGRSRRVRRLDLHGHDVLSAIDLARLTVQEAYANGYQAVELLHGARDVTSRVAAGEGRGAIKWELRAMLERGEFDALVESSEVMEASLRLVLKPNPRPRAERWTPPRAPSRH